MMRLIVDGVFFQLNNTGIARVWDSILRILVKRKGMEIFFLDRGGAPQIEGMTNIPFPTWLVGPAPADSMMLQRVCDELRADAFTSTYYTTPLTTPMALVVHDMIPELFDFNMRDRGWMEKDTAIAYAQRYLCVSQSTRRDLRHFYPEIAPDHAIVSHCGLDSSVFRPRPAAAVQAFREAQGLSRPYFLFVGSRVQHKAYKNSDLFFSALRQMTAVDFDVFCVGGEPEIEPQVRNSLPPGVNIRRVTLTDEQLSLAYAGAIALVYPSLYEGFGMPVIEAMASGCPVIATRRGSLVEAAGDAALFVEGTSIPEMAEAMTQIQDPDLQADLRRRGFAHAARFRWEPMAEAFHQLLEEVIENARRPETQAFLAEWSRLRRLQARVDAF